MTRNVAYLLKGGIVAFAWCLIVFATLSVGGFPRAALADDESDDSNLTKTAYELQQEIEEKQAAYAAAREEADAAAEAIEETQGRIDELEREIPAQQERSARAAREQYKFQQQSAGIVDLLLSTDTFFDFITEVEYMTRISDANAAEMNRLAELKNEIVTTQEELKGAQQEAEARAEDARAAMQEAQEAQAEVQRRIEEEARAQAEIAAMAAALAGEPRDNDSGAPASGGEGAVEKPAEVTEATVDAGKGSGASEIDDSNSSVEQGADSADSSESADDSANEGEGSAAAEEPVAVEETVEAPTETVVLTGVDAYIAEWAPRIDAYLAGSPLAGQGTTFAKAAYEYGVDPRLSPAISFTESSKGLYCFKSHNAWGWGSSSWGSWEEAIYAHVGGLSRGYGGQLSIEGAKKYCPPNWQTWYNRTLEQMNMI